MSGVRRALALGAIGLLAGAAPAQGISFSGGSFNFSRSSGSKSLSFSAGSGFGYSSPYGYSRSPYHYPSYGYSRPRVTVIYGGPQVVTLPPPVLSLPTESGDDPPPDNGLRHIPERRRDPLPDLPPAPPARPAPPAAPAAPAPLPGQNTGVFRPITPEDRERARQPVAPEPPARPPEPPAPELPPPAPELPPGATLVDRGRAAFTAGEYGRAADTFRRAVAAEPTDPVPAFLLVQTLIALEKYTAAADAARAALDRFPNWPALTIRPLELYGTHPDDYAAHRKRLEAIRAEHPDDAVLLFLAGYVLWFDGQKDQARLLFRRAAPAYPAAERFLRPAAPAVL